MISFQKKLELIRQHISLQEYENSLLRSDNFTKENKSHAKKLKKHNYNSTLAFQLKISSINSNAFCTWLLSPK